MPLRALVLLALAACTLGTLAWTQHQDGQGAAPVVDNVSTFARMFGYVRYFHPSDEAADVDWERFAVHGIRQVRDAADASELREVLQTLFQPIAPTVQIYPTAVAPPELPPELAPRDTTGLEIVAWQHKGIGLGGRSQAYRSRRLNRASDEPDRPAFGVLMQSVQAAAYQGQDVRLIASARADVEGAGNQLHLWMRVDRSGGQMGYFDNMDDRPITTSDWETYELTGGIAEDAQALAFGAFLAGTGKGWVDGFRLEVRDGMGAWTPVPLPNGDFEDDAPGAEPGAWSGNGTGYAFGIAEGIGDTGQSALIESVNEASLSASLLFDAHPAPAEVLEKPIGSGLSIRLPLALYSRGGRTLGTPDPAALDRLTTALAGVDLTALTAADEDLRFADVVITWNVLQHFYPYFDVVEAGWGEELGAALTDAADDEGVDDFLETMEKLVARLEDGHGRVGHPSVQRKGNLPFLADVIEDQIVVIATGDSAAILPGDVLLTIDGVPAEEVLAERIELASGSDQWRRHRGLQELVRGEIGVPVPLRLLRDDEEIAVSLQRDNFGLIQPTRPPDVEEIEPGIMYVNLAAAEVSEIMDRIDVLSTSEGVIFDLRGYPNGNHAILQHLTDTPMRSARWHVPQIIYPDRENLAGYDTTGRWYMPPAQPRISGTVVFLTNERAISYAESVMGIVEHYRLGEIIGKPTAGTNGNVNRIQLPGDFIVVFTGMRVLKHDGSQHHLVGIEPTVPLERTLAAVREGRDEYIERAVEVIRSGGQE
jgi:C-terminal processing protease CtpA/Prc